MDSCQAFNDLAIYTNAPHNFWILFFIKNIDIYPKWIYNLNTKYPIWIKEVSHRV